jgi:hypothetical protein
MQYYLKEIPETAVIINGVSMRFDILETADPILISELDKCIQRQIGGVVAITKEQFDEEVKKKANEKLSGNSSNPLRRRQELSSNLLAGVGAAAGAGRSNGQFATPQTGRESNPHNRGGLPKGVGPAPDPIEVPSAGDFASSFDRPPTAKANGRPRRVLDRD